MAVGHPASPPETEAEQYTIEGEMEGGMCIKPDISITMSCCIVYLYSHVGIHVCTVYVYMCKHSKHKEMHNNDEWGTW